MSRYPPRRISLLVRNLPLDGRYDRRTTIPAASLPTFNVVCVQSRGAQEYVRALRRSARRLSAARLLHRVSAPSSDDDAAVDA